LDSSHLQVLALQALPASVGAVEVYSRNRNVYVPFVTLVPSELTTFPWKLIRFGLAACVVTGNKNTPQTTNNIPIAACGSSFLNRFKPSIPLPDDFTRVTFVIYFAFVTLVTSEISITIYNINHKQFKE
jgi:hypothetical protein